MDNCYFTIEELMSQTTQIKEDNKIHILNNSIEDTIKLLGILKRMDLELYENGGGDSWNYFVDLRQSEMLTEDEFNLLKRFKYEK